MRRRRGKQPLPRPLPCPGMPTAEMRFAKRCHGDGRCCNCYEEAQEPSGFRCYWGAR